ncbi:MAG: hypothetical protein HY901_35015 [Deltaproteobacteria bacterium]|nr:hypothetical protein [Deltaproteobacteria bacterium]
MRSDRQNAYLRCWLVTAIAHVLMLAGLPGCGTDSPGPAARDAGFADARVPDVGRPDAEVVDPGAPDAEVDPSGPDAGDHAGPDVGEPSGPDVGEPSGPDVGAEPGADAGTVHVYLLAGQSNMLGHGLSTELSAPFDSPQDDVLLWHDDTLGWNSLQVGSGKFVDGFGPELSFGRAMADARPAERIVLIKHAVGNTNLAYDWKPDTGPQYQAFSSKVAAALRALAERNLTYKIDGFVWMQGESDTFNLADAQAHEANLQAFVARVRSDFDAPALPFVLGRIRKDLPNSSFPHTTVVRDAQAAVARLDSKVRMVDTDDLPPNADATHYSSQGLIMLGQRFANGFLAPKPILSVWFSPATIKNAETSTLYWTSSDTTSCIGDSGNPIATSGQIGPTTWPATRTVKISCQGQGGLVVQPATITVLTLSVWFDPPNITSDGLSTLHWSATDATSCVGDGGNPIATSGQLGPTTWPQTRTVTITCQWPGGQVAQSATITVLTMSVWFNPASIHTGGTSTLLWTSTNATSCVGDSGNPIATSGQVGPTTWPATRTVTLRCQGAGGQLARSATITVSP